MRRFSCTFHGEKSYVTITSNNLTSHVKLLIRIWPPTRTIIISCLFGFIFIRIFVKPMAEIPKLQKNEQESIFYDRSGLNFCKPWNDAVACVTFNLQIFHLLEPWSVPYAVHMISVSPYAFQPLFQRFVRIWRYVQVVSDLITFMLSMICCQCSTVMPLSTSESVDSKVSVQVFDIHAINRRYGPISAEEGPPRCSSEPSKPPHLVIDFPPDKDDALKTRCQTIWDSSQNLTVFEELVMTPSPRPPPAPAVHMIDLTKDPVNSGKAKEQNNSNLPAIHTSKTINKKDFLKDSHGAVNKSFT